MRAFIALVVIVIRGQLKGFWKWVRGLDLMIMGVVLGVPIVIIGTLAYPHVNRYLTETPLQRCVSSKNTYLQMAHYECRIELGMEPIEKPVINRRKKVTMSPERESEPTSQDARQDDDSE